MQSAQDGSNKKSELIPYKKRFEFPYRQWHDNGPLLSLFLYPP